MGFIFLFSAVLAFVGAVMMVSRRSPIYSLLFLLVSFVGTAGLFYALNATFLAVAQVMVYAGAISVLFLFVLMFVDLRREGETTLPKRIDSLAVYDPDAVEMPEVGKDSGFKIDLKAAIFSIVMFAAFVMVIVDLPDAWNSFKPLKIAYGPDFFGSVKAFGQAMMIKYPLHFEVVGLIVLIGVIGAVVLGQRLSRVKSAKPEANQEGGH
ncbi:MAG: NADH-quinone oxidoreductase subunit J [Planctomycetes bacterium]|nr:NADH-quinone oxidoreductase subunit J [Planctomycetota bacterium]